MVFANMEWQKVLSTTSNKLFSFAIMLRRSISHTFNIGLVGVSDQIILVLLLTHDFILDISSSPKSETLYQNY